MTYMPRVAAATHIDWADLAAELDRWEEAGRIARLWWRDDDATAPTPALDRLLTLAADAPLALAVIPQPAGPTLAERLVAAPQVSVLQHGWSHADHAVCGKKSEYPVERHLHQIGTELAAGRTKLTAMFGARALPVFVPPWNRFPDEFVLLLADAGLSALSQQAPRKIPLNHGVAAIDVHLDVTAWHAGCGFVGTGAALGRLVSELRLRRETGDDGAIGILTHHLVMDGATQDFFARLGETVAGHAAVRWAGMPELMAS